MQLKREITINTPTRQVWEILGPGFGDAFHWASSVSQSTATIDGKRPDGAPCSGRVCQTTIGSVKESILEYDAHSHRIAYAAVSDKMPGFVRHMVARWSIRAVAPSKAHVTMTLNVDIAAPFNILMGPMMWLQMGGIMDKTMGELKHYTEQGEPHPRKVKAMAKAHPKAA
ncbi:MAG: SRPBCC family protein [Acidobacteriota bacterium]